jgi:RecA/RadA recombinase
MSDIYKKLLKSKALSDYVITEKQQPEYISTNVLSLNLLFSGRVRGGVAKGTMNMFSADSSLGKSFVGLSILKEAQKMGMDCVVIDAEKSFDHDWADDIGINTDPKVLPVIQVANIIDLKQVVSTIASGKTQAERKNTFILFDSWGPLVSNVILKKAAEGSETKDMSLPGWKNELANVMRETNMTFFVINHVYDNTGGFGDPLKVPGGKRLYFNSQNIVLATSKAKDKDGAGDIKGALITAMTQKGRDALEKAKLKYRIKHDGGLDAWYGLLPDALEHGCVIKPKNGYYSRAHIEDDKKHRESQIYNADFWTSVFQNTDFELYLNSKYRYSGTIDIAETSTLDLLGEQGSESVKQPVESDVDNALNLLEED